MKNKQFTFGAIISYGAIAFNIISGLLYTPWMIKTIGDDQYALYALATSVVNLFLLDFGISASVTKFLSNFYAKGEQDKANKFMGIVYKVFFVISAVIATVLFAVYFFVDVIYAKLSPEELIVFKRLYIIVAVFSVLSFPCVSFNGTLMANERFIEVKLCNLGQRVLNVILIIILLSAGSSVYALVFVNVFSNCIFYLLKYLFIRKKTKTVAELKFWDKGTVKSLFNYSVWVTVLNIAQRFIFNIMPTIIAALVGSAEVTLFSLASTIEGYVFTFSDAINGMFMPKVSKLMVKTDNPEALQSLMNNVGKYHVLTIGLIYVGFICVGKDFISLWMGEGYDLLYPAILLMVLPSLFTTPQQVANTALLTMDIIKPQALIFCGCAVINVTLAAILLPIVGIIGAPISIMIAYMFNFVARNILYRKNLPIKLTAYFKSTYSRWIFVAVITAIAGLLINNAIKLSGWLGLILNGIIVVAIYGILTILIVFKKEDRNAFINKAKGILKK